MENCLKVEGVGDGFRTELDFMAFPSLREETWDLSTGEENLVKGVERCRWWPMGRLWPMLENAEPTKVPSDGSS